MKVVLKFPFQADSYHIIWAGVYIWGRPAKRYLNLRIYDNLYQLRIRPAASNGVSFKAIRKREAGNPIISLVFQGLLSRLCIASRGARIFSNYSFLIYMPDSPSFPGHTEKLLHHLEAKAKLSEEQGHWWEWAASPRASVSHVYHAQN